MKEKLNIELIHWDYTCGDGCCYNYGVKLKLNGEELKHPNPEQQDNSYIGDEVNNALIAVLTKLGYEVEVTEKKQSKSKIQN